jgi:hypothetical protein
MNNLTPIEPTLPGALTVAEIDATMAYVTPHGHEAEIESPSAVTAKRFPANHVRLSQSRNMTGLLKAIGPNKLGEVVAMFTPKVAKLPTKTAASLTNKLALPHSVFGARPFGGDTVEQAHFLQRTIGNQVTLPLMAQQTSGLTENESYGDHERDARDVPRGVSWYFSKMPLFPPDRVNRAQSSFPPAALPSPSIIQPKLAVGEINDPLEHKADRVATQVMRMPTPEVSIATAPSQGNHKCTPCAEEEAQAQREASVEMPGEEEQTADAGTGSGSAASAGCDCVPRQVAIKNVQPYRNGKLYGHSFDVAVSLGYFTPPAGRAGQDAQLIWREKTDRAPSWQGLAANTWNDMFALFPTSPTFAGWTTNRTKPCPGSEVATITDPPAASVDMPARTLEFDISVRGLQVTHNAQAKQVLEPDGSGGIKTQTFTVLPSRLGPGG